MRTLFNAVAIGFASLLVMGQAHIAWAQVSLQRRETVNVANEALADLSRGMTESEVETALGARGKHQFTALLTNGTIRCTTYYRNDVFGRFYLVFTNSYLAAICEPPPFELREVPYRSSVAVERVLGDPEERIARVLAAADITGPELKAKLKRVEPGKTSVDYGLTAAYILTRVLFANRQREEMENRMYSALLVLYDPFKIAIGSSLQEVEMRLGKPSITESLGLDSEMRYYGSLKHLSDELLWLTVVYERNKVIRVFSDDFVDYLKIRPPH